MDSAAVHPEPAAGFRRMVRKDDELLTRGYSPPQLERRSVAALEEMRRRAMRQLWPRRAVAMATACPSPPLPTKPAGIRILSAQGVPRQRLA